MATLPTTKTMSVGETGVSADWNTYVRDAVAFFLNKPCCRVYNNANISITANTNTVLTFNTERYDTDGMHSTSAATSRITCVTAGKYMIGGHINWASAGTDRRFVQILLNGSASLGAQELTGGATSMSVTTCWGLVAGDYIELQVYQNSGGPLNVNAASAYSPEFWATWISA